MSRLVALFFLLCTGLAQAATPTVLQRPIDLDTGQGVLHGSLLLPQQPTPPPVVLIIAGSGPTDRDGNNPASGRVDNLKRLAKFLDDGVDAFYKDKGLPSKTEVRLQGANG